MRNLDEVRKRASGGLPSHLVRLAPSSGMALRLQCPEGMKREPGRGRRLEVKKETLRVLSTRDLEQVQGGRSGTRNNCSAKLSGCIVGMV